MYNRKAATRSWMIKLDLRKANDSVEWKFVREMLIALNFPPRFIQWIIECITTTRYTITMNRVTYGDIMGKRGLR